MARGGRFNPGMTFAMSSSERVERRAAALSITVGIILLLLKFTGYIVTGSTAVFSDALESIVNVLASLFAWYAVRLAHRPADAEHPYGHGKVEFLAAGFEGGLVLVAAVIIAVKAIDSWLFHTIRLERLGLGLALVFTAMIANGAMGVYLIRLGRRQQSVTLEADGRHLLSDAVTSLAALLALAFIRLTGWTHADPIAALAVAAYIARMGLGLVRRSIAGLMDEQDHEDQQTLRNLLTAHCGPDGRPPRICSFHKLRHRHSGRYHWVDFHVMMPASSDIRQGHDVASTLEYEIERTLGEGKATAHVEPCVDEACPGCRNAPPNA